MSKLKFISKIEDIMQNPKIRNAVLVGGLASGAVALNYARKAIQLRDELELHPERAPEINPELKTLRIKSGVALAPGVLAWVLTNKPLLVKQAESKSKSQQRFFGTVLAYKQGKLKASEVSDEVKKAANSMTLLQIEDFARTPQKGLPEKVASFGPLARRAAQALIPGAAAGAVSTAALYPLDTIQMAKQLRTKPPETIDELYKGIGLKMVKIVPTTALSFAVYEVLKGKLPKILKTIKVAEEKKGTKPLLAVPLKVSSPEELVSPKGYVKELGNRAAFVGLSLVPTLYLSKFIKNHYAKALLPTAGAVVADMAAIKKTEEGAGVIPSSGAKYLLRGLATLPITMSLPKKSQIINEHMALIAGSPIDYLVSRKLQHYQPIKKEKQN